jgi:hypothetical protein
MTSLGDAVFDDCAAFLTRKPATEHARTGKADIRREETELPPDVSAREVALHYIRECVKPSESEPQRPWSWGFADFSAWCGLHRNEIGMPGIHVADATVSMLTGLSACSSEFVLTTLAQHVADGDLTKTAFSDCFRVFRGQSAPSSGKQHGSFVGTTGQALVDQLFAEFSRCRQDGVWGADFMDTACGVLMLCGDSEADKLWALFLLFDSGGNGLWSETDMVRFLLPISRGNANAGAGASRLGNRPTPVSIRFEGEASCGTSMMEICARYKLGGAFDGNCEKRAWIMTNMMHDMEAEQAVVCQLHTIEAVNYETGDVAPGVLSLWKGGKARKGGEVDSADEVCATPGLLAQYLQARKPGTGAGVGVYIRFSMTGVWQVRVHGGGYDAISNPIRAVQRRAKRKCASATVQEVAEDDVRDEQAKARRAS